MALDATGRKVLSSVLKNAARFEQENAIGTYFIAVDCKGSAATEPLGTVMKYDVTNSAFYAFAAPSDWEASATYAVGAIVKPTTRNGLEYVCTTAGDSDATEPTWPTIPGMTETETAAAVWLTRVPYQADVNSPLPDGSMLCITVGAKEGIGFNKADVTLSSSAVKMTALFRGEAAVVSEGLEWGAGVAAEDKTEVIRALEMNGIVVATSATNVVPSLL